MTTEQDIDFSFATEYEFSQKTYLCKISTVKNKVLVIEVEEISTGERWRGEFSSTSIEAVTSKTGNFKKFSVFIKMLYSTLAKKTDSCTVDLLTRSQLELLFRKNFTKKSQKTSKNTKDGIHQQKYLILTYTVEYDRVHYPLPLAYQRPSFSRMRKTITELRKQLEIAKKKPNSNNSNFEDYKVELKRITMLKNKAEKELETHRKNTERAMKMMKKEIEILGNDFENQEEEMKALRRKLSSTRSIKSIKSDLIKERKLTTSLRDSLKNKDRINRKKNTQIEDLKFEIAQLKKENKKILLNRSTRRKSRSRIKDDSFSYRDNSPRGRRRSSYKRFDPTAWNKEKKRKLRRKKGKSNTVLGKRYGRNNRSQSAELRRGRSRSNSRRRSRSNSRKRILYSGINSRSRSNSRSSRKRSRSRSKGRISGRQSRESSVERKIRALNDKKKKYLRKGKSGKGINKSRTHEKSMFDPQLLRKRLQELRENQKKKRRELQYMYESAEEDMDD